MTHSGKETVMEMSRPAPRLAVVVPCLDEAETLPFTDVRLRECLSRFMEDGLAAPESFILYVDDGSSDATWDVICGLSRASERVYGLKLASNAGHQQAIMAGMEEASARGCDGAVSIDADLQDDPEAIAGMLREYRCGTDIVFGVRRRRREGIFKKVTARAFYRFRDALGVRTVRDHADFRLLSARAMEALGRYRETNLFLRGIVPMLGYRQASVWYDRMPRRHGKSKYPIGKMLNFAADGITSFSVRPARMILVCGFFFMLIALAILVYSLVRYFTDHTIAGWTSTILSIWFCSGVLLLALGVVGEYLAKVYMEVKGRPRWQVEARTGVRRSGSGKDGAQR